MDDKDQNTQREKPTRIEPIEWMSSTSNFIMEDQMILYTSREKNTNNQKGFKFLNTGS